MGTTACALALLFVSAAPASAAFPGANAKIAFSRLVSGQYDLWTVNGDGSGATPLTSTPGVDETRPAWSADGARLAFLARPHTGVGMGIFVMNADGSDRQPVVVSNNVFYDHPSWSPDGQRIMLQELQHTPAGNARFRILRINLDGTGFTPLRTIPPGDPDDANNQDEPVPAFSPDGSRVAYGEEALDPIPGDPGSFEPHHEVFTMNADGGDVRRLTHDELATEVGDFSWSPDGTRIAYRRHEDFPSAIAIVDAAGGSPTGFSGGTLDRSPAWSPDGQAIAYEDSGNIVVKPAGGGTATPLIDGHDPDWGPLRIHYTVELKAWIPKRSVAGFPPVTTPYLIPHGSDCFDPGGTTEELSTVVSSTFRGDDHDGYDSSFFSGPRETSGFRVRPVAEFDLVAGKIVNFQVSAFADSIGTTHKDMVYSRLLFPTRKCTVEKTATKDAGGRQTSDDSFELFISSANPLVFGAPSIDSKLEGFFTSGERLTLDFETDLFPSHGIRVVRNADTDTFIVNDVACLSDAAALGITGAGLLSYGLSTNANLGRESVIPNDQSVTITQSGQLCDHRYRIVDVAPVPAPGRASVTAAGVRISVAPLSGPGKGRFVPLRKAVSKGLVAATTSQGRTQLAADAATPVELRIMGGRVALELTEVGKGRVRGGSVFGPAGGPLAMTLGKKPAVKRNGRRLRAHRLDHRPPVTSAKVLRRGRSAVIRFSARDGSGVRNTVVTVGRRAAKLRRQTLRLPVSRLGKVRYSSIDIYGNAEKPKRLHAG